MAQGAGNPFIPSFGHVPYLLAGRSELIDDVVGGLANRPGDPNRSTIFFGPRGSGKTVLLKEISNIASEQGWVSTSVSAREGMLSESIAQLRFSAKHLLSPEREADITSLQVGPVGLSRELRHAEPSWRIVMGALVDELNAQGVGVLITVDEVDPECEELIELVDSYQHFVTDDKDVALLLAGLPHRVMDLLLDKQVSFIRRAFQRQLGPIPLPEVENALEETIRANGRSIEPQALAAAAEATHGFALAVQLVGYYLWRCSSPDAPMNAGNVVQAVGLARKEMERSVFIPTLRGLRPREEQYLRAMAQDEGPSSTSEIARRMGISMTNASNLRRRLIAHGVVAEVRMGEVEFDLPQLKAYLREEGRVR